MPFYRPLRSYIVRVLVHHRYRTSLCFAAYDRQGWRECRKSRSSFLPVLPVHCRTVHLTHMAMPAPGRHYAFPPSMEVRCGECNWIAWSNPCHGLSRATHNRTSLSARGIRTSMFISYRTSCTLPLRPSMASRGIPYFLYIKKAHTGRVCAWCRATAQVYALSIMLFSVVLGRITPVTFSFIGQ